MRLHPTSSLRTNSQKVVEVAIRLIAHLNLAERVHARRLQQELPRARANLESMPIENPFQDPLRFERRVPECAAVIFGANGDLTKRKLMPALYRLAFDRRLSAGFAVIGISRTP